MNTNFDATGFCEGGFHVTWAPDAGTLAAAEALRADVFCRELGWVGTAADAFERDPFDAHAIPIVARSPGGEVVATLRLVPGDRPWMFDEIFRDLLDDPGVLRRARAMEASRLAVAGSARRTRLPGGRRLAELLFKGAYTVCRALDVRWVYMVTTDTVGRRLGTAGLPCAPLAAPTRMPDGVVAVPLVLDWDRLPAAAPVRAWFEGGADVVPLSPPPPSLEAERARRTQPSLAPSLAQPWRERRLRASG